MKILKKGELEQSFKKEARRTSFGNLSANKHIYDEVAKLEVGDCLFTEAADWVGYTRPATAVHGITRIRARGDGKRLYNYFFSDLGRLFIGKSFSVKKSDDGYYIIRNEDKKYREHFEELLKFYDSFIKETHNG